MAKKFSDPLAAVAVVRTSTDHQQNSPDAQLAAMQAWATANGVRILEVVYELDTSGGTALEDRPKLREALDRLEVHCAGILLFADRSRIARDTMTAAIVSRQCKSRLAVLRTADGGSLAVDPSDPSQEFIANILDAVAQLERHTIRKRIKAALDQKKKRGELCGNAPYGKAVGPDGKTLIPDMYELTVLQEIRSRRAYGQTIRQICDTLEEDGYKTRKGTTWHPTQIARLLQR